MRANPDRRRLAELARLSEIAYQPEGQASSLARAEGWIIISWLDRGGTEGFLATRERGGDAVVVFRGTEPTSGRDLLTDFRAHKVDPLRFGDRPRGRVHAGFKAALDRVWPRLASALRALRFRRHGLSLWFAGHSLGGALATLAAARVQAQGLGVVAGVATFGCPRLGCPLFAEDLEAGLGGRVHRVVNNCDLFPRLLFLTFAHVGAVLYLTRRGELRQSPALLFVLWDMLLGALLYRVLKPWRWKPDALNDHAIFEYRRVLEALEARP